MKRFLSLVLSFIMLCSFAACGGGERVETTTSDIIIGGGETTGTNGASESGDAAGTGSASDGTTSAGNGGSGGTASGGSGGSGGSTNTSQIDTVKADLKGATIRIVTWETDYFPSSKGATATSKARYEALQTIQKNLNCKIAVTIFQ